jgi:hypothetical protein
MLRFLEFEWTILIIIMVIYLLTLFENICSISFFNVLNYISLQSLFHYGNFQF